MKKLLAFLVAALTIVTCIPFTVFGAEEEAELIGDVQGTVPNLYITVDSGYSLDTIHKDKEAKIRAHVKVTNSWDADYDMESTGIEIKTRGNSTWDYDKKPYQIKFDSKTDMFGMGKAKKWVLLANYLDGSFVRNKIVFDLANNIGMPYTVKSVFVNVYLNGSYHGVYQLCEKVEIGDSRVPLKDDFGVIAEMEAASRVWQEEFYFHTSVTGKPFVYKEYNTDFEDAPAEDVAQVRAFFEERINTLENELYNNGKDWELVTSLIDIDSVIKYYFINEFAMNADATFASTYFYIDGKDDILHMGPVWDYDRSFGSYDYNGSNYEQSTDADFLKNIIDCTDKSRVEWYKMFFRYPQFVERVNEIYDEIIREEFDSERICATIDAYQSLLYDSLMRNYVNKGWALFHNISEAEFFSNKTEATNYFNFTTNYLKNNITERKAYFDKAYGTTVPVLSYSINDGVAYTGGCMTDAESVKSFSIFFDSIIDGSVSYSAMGSNLADTSGADGSSISGNGIYILKMTLTGNIANYYSIQYRVYSNDTWSRWATDGGMAGSRGKLITRVQARLVEKAPLSFAQVSFEGADVPAIEGVVGNKVALPALPEGIDGWYLDADCTVSADSTVVIDEGGTMIYAGKSAKKIMGDLNGDLVVNAKDSNIMKRLVSGALTPTDVQIQNGDVNGDGIFNAMDANVLTRLTAGAE